MLTHLCANLWPACSMRAKWVVAKRTSQTCRASRTTSMACLATWFVNLQLLFSLSAYGVSRYWKTTASSVSLVQDSVPVQCTFHIYDKWQSNDALTIWPFSEEALLIVCFIFSRHLTNQPLLRFYSWVPFLHKMPATIFLQQFVSLFRVFYVCVLISCLFVLWTLLSARPRCVFSWFHSWKRFSLLSRCNVKHSALSPRVERSQIVYIYWNNILIRFSHAELIDIHRTLHLHPSDFRHGQRHQRVAGASAADSYQDETGWFWMIESNAYIDTHRHKYNK